jgi:hypothetical protein
LREEAMSNEVPPREKLTIDEKNGILSNDLLPHEMLLMAPYSLILALVITLVLVLIVSYPS